MPADRVADDLDERILVDVVELPLEAGHRVGLAHQRARRRRVEAALEPRLELPAMEREEVGALLALDVDHLDELACAHLVGERSRGVDAEVEPRLGERRRELLLLVGARRRAPHLDEELGRGRRAVDDAPRRCRDDDGHGALRAERLRRSGGRPLAEEPDRERVRGIEPARAELVREQAPVAVRQRSPDHRRGRVGRSVERGRIVAPVRAEHRDLGGLAPARVDDRHPLVRPEGEHGRAPRPDEVRLDERVLREQTPDQSRARNSRHALAGAFASISAASAMSFSASSRLPSASSFFTSFSTARRLYDWFQ